MSQPTYNHMFSIAFEIEGSTDPSGGDVTPQQLYDAILKRAKNALESGEMLEAVGCPDDSFEEEGVALKSASRPQG